MTGYRGASIGEWRSNRGIRRSCALLAIALTLGPSGCSGGPTQAPSGAAESPSGTSRAGPMATPIPTPAPQPLGEIGVPATVSARANIYGAGHTIPPAPSGGGAGELPPLWTLPSGGTRTVTFPSVSGTVTPIVDSWPYKGAEGELKGPTKVLPWEGISGVIHNHNGMFLVGVFLDDGEPAGPAPPTLNFTDNEDFVTLAPELRQTFLIGDGVGRSYEVPAGATRLFLGFADSVFFQGLPGWYGNNDGELMVTVEVTAD